MEQRVREADNLARIGQPTTSLAHEIRNPLSSIKMSVQIALKTLYFDKSSLRTMKISAREIARLDNTLPQAHMKVHRRVRGGDNKDVRIRRLCCSLERQGLSIEICLFCHYC
jgi:nitrogen-specific signal transduction histidine kinase